MDRTMIQSADRRRQAEKSSRRSGWIRRSGNCGADCRVRYRARASAGAITALNQIGAQLQREVTGRPTGAVTAALKALHPEIDRASPGADRSAESLALACFFAAPDGRVRRDRDHALAVWWYVPSVGQMNQLRAERAELQASIADLTARGGRIQLNECDDRGEKQRLCVRVDAAAGEFGDPQHGKVYMIVKGY